MGEVFPSRPQKGYADQNLTVLKVAKQNIKAHDQQ